MLVLASMTSILIIFGVLCLLWKASLQATEKVSRARYVTAYLSEQVPEAREKILVSAVQKLNNVSDVKIVTKDHFIKNFKKIFPELAKDLTRDLEANPTNLSDAGLIPRYIKVKVSESKGHDLSGAVNSVVGDLKKVHGIESIETNEGKFQGALKAMRSVQALTGLVTLGVILALFVMMVNHFRSLSQRLAKTRSVLKVLGASRIQLVLPVFSQTLFEGIVAGGCAGLALVIGGRYFEGQINQVYSSLGFASMDYSFLGIGFFVLGVGICSALIGNFITLVKSPQ